MAFNYTVLPGENTADLAVTGASLNGATIADGAGNPAVLVGALVNPAGVLQIDTTAPTVVAVATSPGSGSLKAGQVVTVVVGTSEPVTVAGGVPTLTLNDGGMATYVAGASVPTGLAFSYAVAPGENTADLAVTGVSLNGAVVADGAGNAANLGGAVTNPAGVLMVDTIAPTVAGVSTNPASGSVGVGGVGVDHGDAFGGGEVVWWAACRRWV